MGTAPVIPGRSHDPHLPLLRLPVAWPPIAAGDGPHQADPLPPLPGEGPGHPSSGWKDRERKDEEEGEAMKIEQKDVNGTHILIVHLTARDLPNLGLLIRTLLAKN